MKKVFSVIIIAVSILFLSGCDGTITSSLRHDGFTITTNSFICKDLYGKNKKIIKYFDSNYLYTESGEFYEVSLDKKFANQENCKKVNFSGVVTGTFDSSIMRLSDGKYYYTPEASSVTPYTEVSQNDSSYNIYNLFLSDSSILKVITVDSNNGLYYVLKSDGNVYKYNISRSNYNSPYTVISVEVAYGNKTVDSAIIDFNYDASNQNKIYLKTKNMFYKMVATNYDKCSRYVDITCKYELKLDETVLKYKDRIIYDGNNIITDYKMIFTLAA